MRKMVMAPPSDPTRAGQPDERVRSGRRGARMDIAFCYESVLPTRGGCETYIPGLARRLVADGHDVHLYACRWDETSLPENIHYHPIQLPACPRFLRPWFFSSACARALARANHQVSIGF